MSFFLSTETLHLLNVHIPESNESHLKIVKNPENYNPQILTCTTCNTRLESGGFFVHARLHVSRDGAAKRTRRHRQKQLDTETLAQAVARREKDAARKRERRAELRLKGLPSTDRRKPRPSTYNKEHENFEVCTICGKEIAIAYIKLHERLHMSGKSFECDICGKRFTLRCNLLAHKRDTHSDSHNHSCEVCGKSFKHKSTLSIHQKAHEDPSLLYCPACGKKFNSRDCVRQHLRLVHKGATFRTTRNKEDIKIYSKFFT